MLKRARLVPKRPMPRETAKVCSVKGMIVGMETQEQMAMSALNREIGDVFCRKESFGRSAAGHAKNSFVNLLAYYRTFQNKCQPKLEYRFTK